MAKKVTSRKPLKGNKRSHACNATKHTQNLNLQKVKLTNGKSVRITTRELKTAKKTSNIEA